MRVCVASGTRDEAPVPAGRGRRRGLALLVGLLAVAAGCDFPGQPRAADRPVRADRVLDFATLYGRNCAGCHGADGRLGPAPPLNDPAFLAIVPDSVLRDVVEQGRPGTPMPAFAQSQGGPLTDAQVKALAAGIKPRWRPARPPEKSLPPYEPESGGAGKGDAERGRKVFALACACCHGPRGEGGDPDSDEAGAINDPAFLALISDQALRRLAITGRPDLGMPACTEKGDRPDDFRPLNSAEVDDLVALLARWRGGGGKSKK
jgi:mono/diheme cytochrome c family protein